jgi:XapX domain-containing protein
LEDNGVKGYLVSLAVGVLVGLIYSVVDVKSPAPPTIALVGLLGMLVGEHMIAFARHVVTQIAG